MEALAVVGLSSNILQFVDFSCKVFDRVKQLSESETDSSRYGRFLENNIKEFQHLYTNLTKSRKSVQGQSIAMQPTKDPLVKLAQGCEAVAAQMLATLEQLKPKDPDSKRSNLVAAFKMTWQERKIKDMQTQLQEFRTQLIIQLQVMQSDEWIHIIGLLNRIENHNHDHGANMTKQVSQLTVDVQNAVNHWHDILRERSRLRDENPELLPEPQQEDQSNEIPHAASLIWQELSNSPMTITLSLLHSLSFRMMEFRHSEIKEAHHNTFNWAFENPFQTWLTSSKPIFWISGKPGSGKSTLMKFLVDNPSTLAMIKTWSGSKKLVISSYFFWINGSPLQRSQEGLLRAILYEILRQCPEVAEYVLSDQYNKLKISIANRRSTTLDWPRCVLLDAFQRLSQWKHIVETKFCLFIDGLDEYKTDAKHSLHDLIQTIQCLAQLDVKICVASRPWNEFKEAFGQTKDCKLYLQELNKSDIQLFVSDNLAARPEFKTLKTKNSDEADQILEEIVEKSQGVFLWVHLVVRSLMDGLRNHDRLSQLHERLRRFPSDLDDFFRHIFSTLDPIYRMQTAHMFQVALAASQVLSPIAYWYIDEAEEKPDLAISMPIKNLTTGELATMITETNSRLNGRCRGLLEMTPPLRETHRNYRVDFLHRTVRDFFMSNEIYKVFITEQQTDFNVNIAICNAILAEVKSGAMSANIRDFLDIFFAAAKCLEEDSGISPTESLEELNRTIEYYISKGGGSPWISVEYKSFLECVLHKDLGIYLAAKMAFFTERQKWQLLYKGLMSDRVGPGMITVLLLNGPVMSLDLDLQLALAKRLEGVDETHASQFINIILEKSSLAGPKSDQCPLASERLWSVSLKKLPSKDLEMVRKSVAVFAPPEPKQPVQQETKQYVQQIVEQRVQQPMALKTQPPVQQRLRKFFRHLLE